MFEYLHKETSVSGQKMKTKHAKFPLASASHPVTKTKTKILPQDQDPGQNFGLKARKEGRDWHLEASVISGLMSLYSSECICNLQLNNVLERANTGMSRDVAFLVPYKSTCVLLESKRQRPIWCRVWSSELDLCHVPYDKLRVASAAAGLTSSVRYPKTFGLRRTTKKGLIMPIDYSVCPISICPCNLLSCAVHCPLVFCAHRLRVNRVTFMMVWDTVGIGSQYSSVVAAWQTCTLPAPLCLRTPWHYTYAFIIIMIIVLSLYIKHGKVPIRTFVRNTGHGQLSSEWRHSDNSWLIGYGDWRHVATGCNALVIYEYKILQMRIRIHIWMF